MDTNEQMNGFSDESRIGKEEPINNGYSDETPKTSEPSSVEDMLSSENEPDNMNNETGDADKYNENEAITETVRPPVTPQNKKPMISYYLIGFLSAVLAMGLVYFFFLKDKGGKTEEKMETVADSLANDSLTYSEDETVNEEGNDESVGTRSDKPRKKTKITITHEPVHHNSSTPGPAHRPSHSNANSHNSNANRPGHQSAAQSATGQSSQSGNNSQELSKPQSSSGKPRHQNNGQNQGQGKPQSHSGSGASGNDIGKK